MKKLSFAIVAAALVAWASPVPAQSGPGYQGYEFIQAVKSRDANKALQILNDNPGPGVVNFRDGDGNTGLILAVARRDPEWTGFLITKGADPNASGKGGDTPLIVAARIGFDDAIGWLLTYGAKVDGTNKMGETALIAAVQQRQIASVRKLLAAGADPDKSDAAQGYSARQYAERDTRSREILQLIQAKKPKPAAAH